MYSHLLLFLYPLPIEADNERNEHESSRSMQSFIIFFFRFFLAFKMRDDGIKIFSRVVLFLSNLFHFFYPVEVVPTNSMISLNNLIWMVNKRLAHMQWG